MYVDISKMTFSLEYFWVLFLFLEHSILFFWADDFDVAASWHHSRWRSFCSSSPSDVLLIKRASLFMCSCFLFKQQTKHQIFVFVFLSFLWRGMAKQGDRVNKKTNSMLLLSLLGKQLTVEISTGKSVSLKRYSVIAMCHGIALIMHYLGLWYP